MLTAEVVQHRLSFRPREHAPEAHLEGAIAQQTMLSRDSHGARAIFNALDRLANTYDVQTAPAREDLGIAEGQLRDYQARLGKAFAHEAYPVELSQLRDLQKAGLSTTTPEPGADPLPPAAETAERIKALAASHSIESAPQRGLPRSTSTGEVPVTTPIRRQAELADARELAIEHEPDVRPASPIATPAAAPAEDTGPQVIAFPVGAASRNHHAWTRPAYGERVTQNDRQMSLF